MTNYTTVSLMIMIISCFIGLAGWLKGRDTKIINDAEWKGIVNTKLDLIIGMNDTLKDHENRITKMER